MTSQRYRFVLVAILLIFGLFLVACERPMPGNDDIAATATITESDSGADPGSGEEDTGTYPGPSVPETDATPEGYPAGENYPVSEGDEVSSADLNQPAEESDLASEGYPAGEGDVDGEEEPTSDGETPDEDTNEDDTITDGETSSEAEATSEVEVFGEAETTAEGEGEVVSEEDRTHIVAAGDNLFRISTQYGVSWVALAEANNLTDPNDLTVGQELIIPDTSSAETTEPVETSEGAETVEATEDADSIEATEESESTETEESTADESTETIYVVQSGDNLYRISLKFGVSMMEIARLNGLVDFNQVNAGQELIIPAVETTDSEAEEVSHVVQEGETVFSIALTWHRLDQAGGSKRHRFTFYP